MLYVLYCYFGLSTSKSVSTFMQFISTRGEAREAKEEAKALRLFIYDFGPTQLLNGTLKDVDIDDRQVLKNQS